MRQARSRRAQLARLETLAGTKLTQAAITRTGAIEFRLAQRMDAAALNSKLRSMRQDRSVLWAEPLGLTVRTAPA